MLSAIDLGMSSCWAAGLEVDSCSVLDFPTAVSATPPPHKMSRATIHRIFIPSSLEPLGTDQSLTFRLLLEQSGANPEMRLILTPKQLLVDDRKQSSYFRFADHTTLESYAIGEDTVASMPNDVRLNLWRKDLRKVPDWVWERTELETLILADNGLTEVSEQLGKLRHLRTLDLGHNQLASLPESLGDLTELSDFLYLHDNRLTTVPSSLGRLLKLRYLNISENSISAFPESICGLSNLIELRATDNQLTTLPDGVARLARLRELHLRNNKLAALPSTIGELSELRQLDLRANPVESLPSAIAALPKLEKLDLRWVNSLPSLEWFQSLEARGCVVYR